LSVDIIVAVTNALAAGISAIATVVIAIFAYQTIQAYKKQVQIGQEQVRVSQEQVKVSQEQQFNQFRPVLYPAGDLGPVVVNTSGKIEVDWSLRNPVIGGLRNMGGGPAFNIYGILFGQDPGSNTTLHQQRYVVWNYSALSPGQEGDKITLQPFTHIRSDTIIDGYPLYVPNDVDHAGVIARFTLTYHDIFGRKHASRYDYHGLYGWKIRGHSPNIDKDIYNLEQQNLMTKRIEGVHHDMGKMSNMSKP
jgi:hypothetical protein